MSGARQCGREWPIFVISLADQAARRKRISEQLEARGLAYTIIDAIDGRKALPPVCELLIDRKGTLPRMRRRMSDAEYACAISHMLIYRKLIDSDLPGAIVLEDDAQLADGFTEFVHSCHYSQADIVKLDYARAYVWKWWKIPACANVSAYRMTRNSGLLTGYTVSRKAAQRLLKRGLPIRMHADWPIDVSLLRSFTTSPRLVTPNDQAGSALNAERVLIKQKMARPRSLRRRLRDALTKLISTELR